jgi:hypothetical protein
MLLRHVLVRAVGEGAYEDGETQEAAFALCGHVHSVDLW